LISRNSKYITKEALSGNYRTSIKMKMTNFGFTPFNNLYYILLTLKINAGVYIAQMTQINDKYKILIQILLFRCYITNIYE